MLENQDQFPQTLPVLVETNTFLYPFMISPLIYKVEDENIQVIDYALENNSLVMIVPSKDSFEGKRDKQNIYDSGVVGSIMRKTALPDGRVKILFQGLNKAKILEFIDETLLEAVVDTIEIDQYDELKVNAIVDILKEKLTSLSKNSDVFPHELLKTIDDNYDPNRIVDLVASTIKIKKDKAYKLFSSSSLEDRLLQLIEYIGITIDENRLKREIKTKVHSKIDKVNKEYFLKEQLKQIQKELGTDNQREEEIEEYRKKLTYKKKFLNKEAYKEIKKQIDRLSRMHPDSADASMIQGYLDWVLEIPFGKLSKKKLDIKDVRRELNNDHYSLEKTKREDRGVFCCKRVKRT